MSFGTIYSSRLTGITFVSKEEYIKMLSAITDPERRSLMKSLAHCAMYSNADRVPVRRQDIEAYRKEIYNA